jgi:hypothetical protein
MSGITNRLDMRPKTRYNQDFFCFSLKKKIPMDSQLDLKADRDYPIGGVLK